MFCASLRRRPSYASILRSLTTHPGLKLQENDLATFDILLPTPASQPSHNTTGIRLLLLSPTSLLPPNLPSTISRIQHFAALTGGQSLAIVFLLNPPVKPSFQPAITLFQPTETSTTGVLAYSALQARLFEHPEIPNIPLLPLEKVEGLPEMLVRYAAAIGSRREREGSGPVVEKGRAFKLLRLCTVEPPLGLRTAFVVTDVFGSVRELAVTSTGTESEHGYMSGTPGMNGDKMDMLKGLVSEDEYRDLVDFWREEYVVE